MDDNIYVLPDTAITEFAQNAHKADSEEIDFDDFKVIIKA